MNGRESPIGPGHAVCAGRVVRVRRPGQPLICAVADPYKETMSMHTPRWAGLMLLACLFVAPAQAQENAEGQYEGPLPAGQNRADQLSPFRENWILGELRSIRADMMQYRNDMNRIVTDRELEVADKAMSYATSTVTYFFYLIAGAASMLALVGWSTLRDMKDKIRSYA